MPCRYNPTCSVSGEHCVDARTFYDLQTTAMHEMSTPAAPSRSGRAGMRSDNVVEKIWKGLGGDQEEVLSTDKRGGYKTEVEDRIEERERQALSNKVKEERHSEIYGGFKEYIEMKTCLHVPMDYAKKLKLRFRVGNLDLPERRKRFISSREEDVATNMCRCGTAIE